MLIGSLSIELLLFRKDKAFTYFDFRVPQLLRRGTRPRFLGRGFSGDLLIVGHLLDRLVHPITVN